MTAETLDQARERLRPYVERAASFTGWMGHPEARLLGPSRPWDYMARARELVDGAASVLDMGTGGGERFGDLLAGYHGRALATEEWDVNAPIAAAHLTQFGAQTVRCLSVHLPFADESFDLVLNRHEDLDPSDVARVLRPGGTLLTQQVWQLWREIRRYIPRMSDFGDHFHAYQDGFGAAGLQLLDAREHFVNAAYAGLGELVYMLCIAPWEIPGFDPLGSDLEALLQLERKLTTPHGLVLTDGSYIIEARKPR